jgi:hypothetical protein
VLVLSLRELSFFISSNRYILILGIEFPENFHFGIGFSEVLETMIFVETVFLEFVKVVLFLVEDLLLLDSKEMVGDVV